MAGDGARVVAFREGQTETAILLQTDWGGAPVYQQLVTNAHSMTSSIFYGRRYMKLFAYWPLALRPQARRALLISYGLGNTAEALVRAPGLERIDVVDTSRTILSLSPLAARGGRRRPARRPAGARARRGRPLLPARGRRAATTSSRPSRRRRTRAGIASLYSLEYFRLTRSRLVPGRDRHALAAREPAPARGGARRRASLLRRVRGLQPVVGRRLRLDPGRYQRRAGAFGVGLRPAVGRGRRRPATCARSASSVPSSSGRCSSPTPRSSRSGRRALRRSSTTSRAVSAAAARGPRTPRPTARCSSRRRARSASARAASRCGCGRPALRERTFGWFAWQGVFNRDYEAAARPEALAELWAVLEATPLRDAAAAAARQRAADPRDRAQPPRRGRSPPRARLPPGGRRAGGPRLRGRRPLLRRGARGGQRLPLAAPAARPRAGAGRPPRRGPGGGAGRAGRRRAGPRPPVAVVAHRAPRESRRCGRRRAPRVVSGRCLFASDLHGREDRYLKLLAAIRAERPAAVFLGGRPAAAGGGAPGRLRLPPGLARAPARLAARRARVRVSARARHLRQRRPALRGARARRAGGTRPAGARPRPARRASGRAGLRLRLRAAHSLCAQGLGALRRLPLRRPGQRVPGGGVPQRARVRGRGALGDDRRRPRGAHGRPSTWRVPFSCSTRRRTEPPSTARRSTE